MRSLTFFQIKNKIAYKKSLPPKEAKFKDFDFKNKKLKKFLKEKNIKLFSHQAEAIDNILNGRHTVITTATASGKSYIYIFSILEKLEQNPNLSSVIVFPLKALARDQFGRIKDIIDETGIKASVNIYDGDTPKGERQKIRANPPNFLITTPDMLNAGILPNHRSWERFFENLEFVVLDEIHAYRGVLGSHIANIIKRLKRISQYHSGRKLTFIMNSATVHNPSGFASKLINEDENSIVEIFKSGASSPEREIYILKDISSMETIEFLASTILEDISTIVFVDSRKEAEILTIRIREFLKERDKEHLIEKVSPYRSGYTPEERREIEFKLKTKNILCVISTSALEMGIDIGDIENCYLVGYPGTLAQLWQRFGRAGRRDRKAYNILAPKKNALDEYFVKNPEELFNRQMEEPIINPLNKYILKKHLPVMAKEIPIRTSELNNTEKEVAKELIKENKLYYSRGYLYNRNRYKPFSIRSAGETFKIVDFWEDKVVGDISEDILPYEAHYGAIYLHNGEKYIVKDIDFKTKTVIVEKEDIKYITQPMKESSIEILSENGYKKVGRIEIYKGKVNVKTTVYGYELKELEINKTIKTEIFEDNKILEREFETVAFWFTMPPYWEGEIKEKTLNKTYEELKDFVKKQEDFPYTEPFLKLIDSLKKDFDFEVFERFLKVLGVLKENVKGKDKHTVESFLNRIRKRQEAFIGGLHGVEHGLIAIYPLFAMNDRWDIGGLSTPYFELFQKPTIFIYDGYEGGVGYSEVGFERLPDMIKSTYKNISKCKCIDGCPSCIYSPKCGNSNDYLNKVASILLAEKILKELN